ncbi:HNH endonuclease signature motif containing protein, partial [Desulfatitalea tepidiphila]|uniref:HNH endonuclease signature motif containing protein n=1 Tax=Desulfatitalea tepidiphila TaxID=1185843 RepID=UPI00128EF5A3
MANKPRKYCAAFPCPNLAEPGSSHCREHRPPAAEKVTDPFYNSTAWKRFRTWYKSKHPLCEDCLAAGHLAPVDIVDHVVEIKDGGARLDESNARSLCRSCHARKTAAERKRRENRQQGNPWHRAGNTTRS